MKRLLNKTFTHFAICAFALFALTLPLFYFLTKNFYAEDMIDIINAVEAGKGVPPLDLEEDIIEGMILQLVVIFLVLSVVLLIILRFIAGKLWQPFYETLNKMEHFNITSGEIPAFSPTDIKEFDSLNNGLTQLMQKDRNAFQAQKEFTENASHELQTPLAIMRGKLDLLMQEPMSQQGARIVSEMGEVNMRMSHLNKGLLLLAKIENDQYGAREPIPIIHFTENILPDFDVLKGNTRLQLTDLSDHQEVFVKANSTLFRIMLNNLIVNALRHTTGDNGIIEIIITRNDLSVCNQADNGTLDATKIFSRFHTDDQAKGGNGLGLSIVKAICDYHGWTIQYSFQHQRHCFTVTFSPIHAQL